MSGDTAALDLAVKLAIYRHFATKASRPTPRDVAASIGAPAGDVTASYARLRQQRVLVLEPDGESIRMAPPFSGVPTQHVVETTERSYFANCAWDSLGIPAALHVPAVVHSRCGQSNAELRLPVGLEGPEPSDWLFHCQVPAAEWWDDIVFT
jgi:hypothetical protein